MRPVGTASLPRVANFYLITVFREANMLSSRKKIGGIRFSRINFLSIFVSECPNKTEWRIDLIERQR